MVKSKREWKCTVCDKKYIVWQGICTCGEIGTIVEQTLRKNDSSIRRRWKNSERTLAKSMVEADGEDPLYRGIASSTGRVGFVTGMRFDTVSRTYVNEDKNRPLPKWLIDAWILIQQRSIDLKKNALLHIRPPNMPATIKLNGENFKSSTMAIITQDHHLELVKQAKVLRELEEIILSNPKYKALQEQLWILKKK